MPDAPAPAAATEIAAGVSLATYAAVNAALAEGFLLSAILPVEGLDAPRFEKADLAWKQRLAAVSTPPDGLLDRYRAELAAAAEDWLARPVPPLDDDPAAWMAFVQALSTAPEPPALLSHLGVGNNDVSRLSRRWARRLDEDEALQEQIAELHRTGPGPLPPISPVPAKLRPSRTAPPRLIRAPARAPPGPPAPPPLTFEIARDASRDRRPPPEPPPPLIAFPPAPPAPLPSAAGTLDVGAILAGPALPFVAGGAPPEVAFENARLHAERVQGPAPAAPNAGGTADVASILAGPALPFGPKAAAPPPRPRLRRSPAAPSTSAPSSRARRSPSARSRPPLRRPPRLRRRSHRARRRPAAPSTSAPSSRAPRSPSPRRRHPLRPSPPPSSPSTSTPPSASTCAAVPTTAPRPSRATASRPTRTRPSTRGGAPASWPTRRSTRRSRPPAARTSAGSRRRPAAATRPAPAPAAPAASPAPELSLQQVASLTVDLAVDPSARAETLRRYGLDERGKAHLDAVWGQRIAADRGARAAFDGAVAAYREWLARARR